MLFNIYIIWYIILKHILYDNITMILLLNLHVLICNIYIPDHILLINNYMITKQLVILGV